MIKIRKKIVVGIITTVLTISLFGMEFESGMSAFQSGHYLQAMKILLPLANGGNDEAQRIVGEMCFNGQGVKPNALASFKWNELAAEKGNKVAQYNLGFLYEKGLGVNVSTAKAIDWYTKAATQGYPSAQRKLGDLYAVSNQDISIYWYDQARQNGDEQARKKFSILSSARLNERLTQEAKTREMQAEEKRIDREKAEEEEDNQKRLKYDAEQDNQPEESMGAYIQRMGRENAAILSNIDRKTKVAINQSNRVLAVQATAREQRELLALSEIRDRENQRRAESEHAVELQEQQVMNKTIIGSYKSSTEESWDRQIRASKKIVERGVVISSEKTEDAAMKAVLQHWEIEKRSIESDHNKHLTYGRIIKFGTPTCTPHRGPRTKEHSEGEIFDWRCSLSYTLEVVDQGRSEGIGISR